MRASLRCGPGRDAGSGSVLALGLLAAIVIVTTTVQAVALGTVAHARAFAAADASALAAADAASGRVGEVPCEAARRVASAHRARLVSCRLDGLVATVSVAVPAPLADAPASATAGPP